MRILSSRAFGIVLWSLLILTFLHHGGVDMPSPFGEIAKLAADFVWLLLNPFVFFPLFAAGWYFTLQHFAGRSGWKSVAQDYAIKPSGAEPHSKLKTVSGKIGGVNFARTYRIGASDQGLVMTAILPFRPGHPPLLIPWSQVEVIPVQPERRASNLISRFINPETVTIRIRSHPEFDLQVYADDFEKSTVADFAQ